MKTCLGLMLLALIATPALGQTIPGDPNPAETAVRYDACLATATRDARRRWLDMEAYEIATGAGCAGLRLANAEAQVGRSHGRDGIVGPNGATVAYLLRQDLRQRREAGQAYSRDYVAAHAGSPRDRSLAAARADLLICLEGVYQTFDRPHAVNSSIDIIGLRRAAAAQADDACPTEAGVVANLKAAEFAGPNEPAAADHAEAMVYVGDLRASLNRRYDRWWQEVVEIN